MSANGLLNIDKVNYDLITANEADIVDLEVQAITPLSGNNIAVNGNLIVSNPYSVTGNIVGNLTGDSIGLHTSNVIGNLQENVTGTLTGAVNGTALGFTGPLYGDVIGTQFDTKIAPEVITNANIAPSTAIQDSKLATISSVGKVANTATTASVAALPNTIALRDGSGGLTASSLSTNLAGDVIGPTSSNTITVGAITNAKIAASAGIVDSKLATISTTGKVANSATTATPLNTGGAIVARDSSGDISVRNINLKNATFGYGNFTLSGGNSNGGLYPAFSSFGDGVHFGYNYSSYASSDSQTPSIINSAAAAM